MSTPSNHSQKTAISAFEKLDQASRSYNQDHDADLSNMLAEIPRHLSDLILHAVHLKEKCQNARKLFQNVIDLNLEVRANMDGAYKMDVAQQYDHLGIPTVRVPERRGRGSIVQQNYMGRPGSPQMVLDITEQNEEPPMQPPRIVQDGVNDAATIALDHCAMLQMAHDAQDGIISLHRWAAVFELEDYLLRDGALNSVRRVLAKPEFVDTLARSYTKNGVPLLAVISGRAPISEIEKQNRILSERVVLADLFISFYSDVAQTLQFVHDNLDSFRTVQRKLSEEMKLVNLTGDDRRDVLRQAVLATSEAYDAIKAL